MSFNSLAFLLFLPVVLTLWRVIPTSKRWLLLLAASCLFYGWFNAWLLLLIAFTTLVTYLSARKIEETQERKKKNLYFALSLISCLGVLFFFKYLDFTAGLALSVARLFGANVTFDGFHLILPMGISFYTFQTLSYVIDVRKGNYTAERHFGYYALYVIYFPQLVAGPIERPGRLLTQLRQAKNPSADDCLQGIHRIVIGFVKKVFIADLVAPYVNVAYAATEANGLTMLVATLLFAVQIYCDFSAYTDIAIGCAKLMGVTLSENFHSPYLAKDIKDFWRRWHVSLTSWFTDYVYIPLGGSRKGLFRHCRNILIVFLLSGLWHGASLNFVVWGAIHGVALVLYTLWQHAFPDRKRTKLREVLSRILTLSVVTIAWVFFRSETLFQAVNVVKTIFTDWQGGFASAWDVLSLTTEKLFALLSALLLLPFLGKIQPPKAEDLPLWQAKEQSFYFFFLFLSVLLLATGWLATLASGTDGTFIYFQF